MTLYIDKYKNESGEYVDRKCDCCTYDDPLEFIRSGILGWCCCSANTDNLLRELMDFLLLVKANHEEENADKRMDFFDKNKLLFFMLDKEKIIDHGFSMASSSLSEEWEGILSDLVELLK